MQHAADLSPALAEVFELYKQLPVEEQPQVARALLDVILRVNCKLDQAAIAPILANIPLYKNRLDKTQSAYMFFNETY